MKPAKYKLKNGLTVLLADSRKSPVVSVQMWVRTGSADERPSEAGISHFIEHLVFKGTRHFGVGEIASTVEGDGGELNAYTSFDQTVFHVTIASAQADTALKVIAEMMGHPRFDPVEIDREREVVIEEIKRGNDSPGRRSSQLLFSTAYRKHPYGRPVIGYEDIIRKVSVETLKKYYAERYCPENMFLLVAGDFDRAEMKEKIRRFYGDFDENPLRKVKRAKEAKPAARVTVEKAPFKESHVNLCWRIPPVDHADVPGLDALALILGQGDSSRLTQRLRMENTLVNSIGASAFTPLDDGIFTVGLSLDAVNIGPALAEVSGVMSRFFAEGPTADELAKAVVNLASDTIYSLETVDGLARSFGSMEFYLHDPLAFKGYLKTLTALKPADVARLARKYLKPDRLVATVLTDGQDAPIKSEIAKFRKSYYPKATPKFSSMESAKRAIKLRGGIQGTPVENPIRKVKLPGGGFLLLKRQPETPTVSFRLAVGGGLAAEPEGKDGLNELLTRTWAAGGAKFSELELNREVDAMAAGFSTFAGRNTIGLNADFISSFDSRMWALIEDCVRAPSLPAEVFARERTLLLRQTQMRKDHPSSVCMRAFNESMFAMHPYAKDAYGTENSLPALEAEDLRGLYGTLVRRGNFAAAVVGDFDPDVWVKRIEGLVSSLPQGPSMLKEVPHAGPAGDIRIFNRLDKEQTHLVIGMKGLGIKDPRRWALAVMQAILAGQGGRLFIELRDKKSLAYSVSPIQMEGLGTGTFGAYIACSPEKAALAEKMIRQEFVKLVESNVGPEELTRARRYLIGRTAIDLQKKSTTATSILFDELYGNDPMESLHPERWYEQVTASDVRELAEDLFARPTVLSAVGPRSLENT